MFLPLFAIIGAVLLVLLVVAAAVLPMLAAVAHKREAAVAALRAELGERIVHLEPHVACYGLESRPQRRQNGCLALTADELVFRGWKGERLVVARAAITGRATARAFAGAEGAELVVVRFSAEAGADAVAFRAPDPARLLAALE